MGKMSNSLIDNPSCDGCGGLTKEINGDFFCVSPYHCPIDWDKSDLEGAK